MRSGAKLSGAKLSWCQIVRMPNCFLTNQIVHFIMLVPNCPTIVNSQHGLMKSSRVFADAGGEVAQYKLHLRFSNNPGYKIRCLAPWSRSLCMDRHWDHH